MLFLNLKKFGESRRNTHFIRLKYVSVGQMTSFSCEFISRKAILFEEINLAPISQTGYILNIDKARNKEKSI